MLIGTELSSIYDTIGLIPNNNNNNNIEYKSILLPPKIPVPQKAQQANVQQAQAQQAQVQQANVQAQQARVQAQIQYVQAQRNKKETTRFMIFSFIIIFALGIYSAIELVIKEFVVKYDFSYKQELGLRLLYPLLIFGAFLNMRYFSNESPSPRK